MYTVEKILDKRIDNQTKKQYYLVKWKGWDDQQASWEPYQHLEQNCQELLHQFQAQFGHYQTTIFGKLIVKEQKKQKGKKQKRERERKQTKTKTKRILKRRKQGQQDQIEHNQSSSEEFHQQKPSQTQVNKLIFQIDQHNSKANIKFHRGVLNFHNITPEKKGLQGQEAQHEKLHRRCSIDKFSQKDSNFNVVNSLSEPTPLFTKAIDSHKKRTKQRQQPTPPIKIFTPIILPTDRARLTRRSSIHNITQYTELSSEAQLKNHHNHQKTSNNQHQLPLLNSIPTQRIDIIGMRRIQNQGYQFFVSKDGERKWVSHAYLFQNFARELCKFYEKNIVLQ